MASAVVQPSMEGRASPVSRSVGRHAANVIIPQSRIPFGPVVGGRTDGRMLEWVLWPRVTKDGIVNKANNDN